MAKREEILFKCVLSHRCMDVAQWKHSLRQLHSSNPGILLRLYPICNFCDLLTLVISSQNFFRNLFSLVPFTCSCLSTLFHQFPKLFQ